MAFHLDNEVRLDEVLSFLPPYEVKCILELGEGGGCFIGELAKKPHKVISVYPNNNMNNGHHENFEFMCADVNSPDLHFPTESMSLIFVNCLSMSLSDVEIKDVAKNLIKWIKMGGYILFKDPHFNQAGDDNQKNNDTQDFRRPAFYTKVFKECYLSDDVFDNSCEFSFVGSKCIGAQERNKKNHTQIWWIWKKVNSNEDMGSQPFLDNVQYKNSAILRFERIFGEGFVCIGGIDTTKEFVAMLDLKSGQKVLDVGCGSGGSAFYMVDNFDIDVVGIDLSVNMISLAVERSFGHKRSVEFEVANCMRKSYPDNTFDVIYSRDVILHIQDKPALLRNFFKWLKPGGKVFITDYCRKTKTSSPDVEKFFKELGYDLPNVESYFEMFKDAGFQEVKIEDRTEQSKEEFIRHLKRLENKKEEFVLEFSEEEYNEYLSGWKENMTRIASGDQMYFIFFAEKK